MKPATDPSPVADALRASELVTDAAGHDLRSAVAAARRLFPTAAPVGRQGPPAAEGVRFLQELSFAFPTAEVVAARAERGGDGERIALTTALMGLYGAVSPLPAYVTERLLADDETSPARGLIDLLHHRVLALLYRALTRYRAAVPPPDGDGLRWMRRLQAVAGLPEGGDGAVRGERLLGWAGLLARQPRGADALAQVIGQWFAVPCAVEQCVARWTDLPATAQTRLGEANATLGGDVVCGERVLSRATAFRLAIGPVPWDQAVDWQPGGGRFAELHALVDALNGDALDWELDLVVDTAPMPALAVDDPRAQLGWTTRLAGPGERFHHLTVPVAGA